MADQSSGGSATSFRTGGAICRAATSLQPPLTDAAAPALQHDWVNVTSGRARGRPSAQLSVPMTASRSFQRPVFELASTDGVIADGISAVIGRLRKRQGPAAPAAALGRANRHVSAGSLVRRPLVALALVPRPAVLFLAGAVAGAIGKTITAPLDRVKILLQVKGGLEREGVRAAAASGGVWKSLVAIGKAEGLRGYWRGNAPQVLRVIPYSAAQLYSYELFKRYFQDPETGGLSVRRRLAAGACAGMASTLVTYPLDTLRLRLAVDPSLRGVGAATGALLREGGAPAFYRGLGIALLGIAPYMALELAAFDLLPQSVPSFARGFSAALMATSVCYPLDTIRRQVQMESAVRVPVSRVLAKALQAEGVRGLYRGFLPNALKNLPNKGIRLSTFDTAKKVLAASEAALEQELAKQD